MVLMKEGALTTNVLPRIVHILPKHVADDSTIHYDFKKCTSAKYTILCSLLAGLNVLPLTRLLLAWGSPEGPGLRRLSAAAPGGGSEGRGRGVGWQAGPTGRRS